MVGWLCVDLDDTFISWLTCAIVGSHYSAGVCRSSENAVIMSKYASYYCPSPYLSPAPSPLLLLLLSEVVQEGGV